jgi:hypothetical protein
MFGISRHEHTLKVRSNSKTEIYVPAFPHLQFKQLYRVSHFNPAEILLKAFEIMFNVSTLF